MANLCTVRISYLPVVPFCLGTALLVGVTQPSTAFAQPSNDAEASKPSIALGIGAQRLPDWLGAKTDSWQAIPFFDIEYPGYGELSSTDGLTLHLPHEGPWEAGLYGNFMWGRSRSDLGPALAGKVPSLSPRLHGGVYAEYQFNPQTSAGLRLSHDFTGSGAYLSAYFDRDLPGIWYIQHSVSFEWRGMNGAAMNRYFGLNPQSAAALGTSTWRPSAGSQQVSANYSIFVPTSQHTGIAASLEYARLLGDAANSPLVKRFGSRNQLEQSIAFVYHF